MTKMKTITAAALAVATLAFAAPAQAGHYHHHHGHTAAAGVFGFAAGAIVGSALAQPRRQPNYIYVEPTWNRADWIAYCSRKYRSFNPNTGLYLARSGHYRQCR